MFSGPYPSSVQNGKNGIVRKEQSASDCGKLMLFAATCVRNLLRYCFIKTDGLCMLKCVLKPAPF